MKTCVFGVGASWQSCMQELEVCFVRVSMCPIHGRDLLQCVHCSGGFLEVRSP